MGSAGTLPFLLFNQNIMKKKIKLQYTCMHCYNSKWVTPIWVLVAKDVKRNRTLKYDSPINFDCTICKTRFWFDYVWWWDDKVDLELII